MGLQKEKILAVVTTLEKNEQFLSSLLIYLGSISMLMAFPFFPPYLIPFVALIPAAIGYKHQPLGVIVSMFIGEIAIAYQSPLLAWLFTLLLTASLVLSFNFWYIFPLLQILVFAPFSRYLAGFGALLIPVMFLSALRLGAKRSLMITLPSLYMVLLLSAMWGVDNTSFLVISVDSYRSLWEDFPEELVAPIKPPATLSTIGSGFSSAMANLLSSDTFTFFSLFLGRATETTLRMFFADVGLVQILLAAGLMYVASFLPGVIRHRFEQTISSLIFWLIIPMHILFGSMVGQPISMGVPLFVVLTTLLVYYLDLRGVYIAGQVEAVLREKERKFAKFGVQDLGLASKVTLKDIGDYDDVKEELRNAILMPLRRREIALAYGIKPPKGILLFGPPGTGKTLLMRALAKELEVGFYYVKASQLMSQWFGESEKNISEIFNIARKNAPAVLFFDEIDAIGKSREYYRGEDAAARMLSTLLEEMDGLQSDDNVLVVGATNVPHMLDKALMRPGRFDKIIYMHLPDEKGRLQILKVHLRKVPLADDVDLEYLAKKTERFSGADLANLCKEAVRLAAQEAVQKNEIIPVSMRHFKQVLSTLKPSTTLEMLDTYERFRIDYERRVGRREEKKEKPVRWEDVIGLDEVKKALREAVELPLLHEDLLKEYDVRPSKGVLMFGPPGCGKTMLAKAAANELKANFFALSGADLLKEGYAGAVAKIKEVFNRARENTPAIVFIDEIESVAPSRDLYSSKYVEDVVTQLLQELDGIRDLKGVVLLGATNKPDMLDTALLRPGRFDKIVFVPPPLEEQRVQMFKRFLAKVPTRGLDYERLAKLTEGFSGADIASVCREAKMELVRRKIAGEEAVITQSLLENIIAGRRPSITLEMMKMYAAFLEKYGERK